MLLIPYINSAILSDQHGTEVLCDVDQNNNGDSKSNLSWLSFTNSMRPWDGLPFSNLCYITIYLTMVSEVLHMNRFVDLDDVPT